MLRVFLFNRRGVSKEPGKLYRRRWLLRSPTQEVGDIADILGRIRRSPVEEKDLTYGSTWGVNFARCVEWATASGVSAIRRGFSAESRLFSRSTTGPHLMRTYEIPKEGDPTMCFMGCGLKFDERGMLADDNVARCPRFCRFYQLFDFELLDESETSGDERAASKTLRLPPKLLGVGTQGPISQK